MKEAISLKSFDFYPRDVAPADVLEQGRNVVKAQCYSMTIASVNVKAELIGIMEKLEQLCYRFVYLCMCR